MALAFVAAEKPVIPPPEMKTKPIIFKTNDAHKCLATMRELQAKGKPVAVDAEGISLSAKGRMTLLQMCSWDGQVYLIDLIDEEFPKEPSFGKRLLENGGVKELLQNSRIVKVMHSCSNDFSALWFQFDIRMNSSQIFDTQSADKVLQSLDGTVFPRRRKLNHLTESCGTPPNPLKDDHDSWVAGDKEVWAKRPLSNEMISYASYDVLTLIPELYTELKEQLEQKGGMPRFRQYVDWDANNYIERDRVIAEKKADPISKDGVKRLYQQIQRDHTPYTSIDDLTEDERSAVRLLQENRDVWGSYSNPTVNSLEEKLQLQWITKMQEEVDSNLPGHYIGGYNSYRLYTLGKHFNGNIRNVANRLQTKIRENKDRSGGKWSKNLHGRRHFPY